MNISVRKPFLMVLGLLAAINASSWIQAVEGVSKPNVIFILADDLGIGNVGCYGSDNYKTPNIDKLAQTGTRFTRAFTASLCGPSRAMIMSGRYAFRNGSSNQDACIRMDPSEIVLPKVFKSAGYVSSAIGKWGQLPGLPGDHGFDDYLRFNGSGVYWNKTEDKPEPYLVNGKEMKLADQVYMPDLMHSQAIGFIKQNRTKPFFLYYSMSHVHGEIQPTPDSAPDSKDLFGDNVLYMDKLVGNLVAEIDALKLRENTLIIFIGDNGTGKGQDKLSTIGGKNLSGMKGTMLECGGLVPMIANWPGKTPEGKVCADLIDTSDFVTTFAELTGGKLPEKKLYDGHSIAGLLRGEVSKPREWVYNQLASMWYVRDAQWKLNHLGELYDMSGTPFTEKLIAAESTDPTAVSARTRLAAVLATLDPAGGILDTGDGTGRHASKAKKKADEIMPEKSSSLTPTKVVEPNSSTPSVDADAADRAAKFDKLDKDKVGRLTREYYTSHQSDPVAAGDRFDKYDSNKDGFLSRDEFIGRGRQ